jgi:hypothetical protein
VPESATHFKKSFLNETPSIFQNQIEEDCKTPEGNKATASQAK